MADHPIPASSSAGKRAERWRDRVKIHPAAELFPLMPPDELQRLADDIKRHGIAVPPVFFKDEQGQTWLLDGRNRLDALELAGGLVWQYLENPVPIYEAPGDDPHETVVSLNILRRHLTTAQRQELIDKLLIENPDRSDRQTAALAKVSPTTVGTRRQRLEENSAIPKVTETVGADGRIRATTPARRKTQAARERAENDEWRADLAEMSPEERGEWLAKYSDVGADILAMLPEPQRAQWEAEMTAAQAKSAPAEPSPEPTSEPAAPVETSPVTAAEREALQRLCDNLVHYRPENRGTYLAELAAGRRAALLDLVPPKVRPQWETELAAALAATPTESTPEPPPAAEVEHTPSMLMLTSDFAPDQIDATAERFVERYGREDAMRFSEALAKAVYDRPALLPLDGAAAAQDGPDLDAVDDKILNQRAADFTAAGVKFDIGQLTAFVKKSYEEGTIKIEKATFDRLVGAAEVRLGKDVVAAVKRFGLWLVTSGAVTPMPPRRRARNRFVMVLLLILAGVFAADVMLWQHL